MSGPGAARIADFRPTVFAEMSDLSAKHRAVNLGQGFPDFDGPAFVLDGAARAIRDGHNQYAHPHGVLSLREAIASDWQERFGIAIDPLANVTVTSGATEAIFDVIMSLLDPGDEMVTFEPFYDSYPASVTMAGATMRAVRLQEPDWAFDESSLRSAIMPRTKAILLNTPHNPTGKVFSRSELAMIASVAAEHDLVVITDEVYDRITFDGAEHIPVAALPGMWERTVTINSTGKTFSLTGWKVGYAIGPEALLAPMRAVHQFVTFATATPFQIAMGEAMVTARENGYYAELADAYAQRRAGLTNALESAGLPVLPIGGSYFLLASFAHLPFLDDMAFSRWLIEEVGVTPIPPSAFYMEPASAPKLARFCFAKSLETIAVAGERLQKIDVALSRMAAD
jgi:aspartate/methionine/tyrosine aminotransferase